MEIGTTRNMLAHDDPPDPAAQAERSDRAWAYLPDPTEGAAHLLRYLRTEGLCHD